MDGRLPDNGADIYAGKARAVHAGDKHWLRTGELVDWSVLLPARSARISRPFVLRGAVAAIRRARRLRASLCDRARAGPSRPEAHGDRSVGARQAAVKSR